MSNSCIGMEWTLNVAYLNVQCIEGFVCGIKFESFASWACPVRFMQWNHHDIHLSSTITGTIRGHSAMTESIWLCHCTARNFSVPNCRRLWQIKVSQILRLELTILQKCRDFSLLGITAARNVLSNRFSVQNVLFATEGATVEVNAFR